MIAEFSKCHRDEAFPSINARRVWVVWSSSTKDCVPSTEYRSQENTGNNARPSVIPQQTFSWRLINYSRKFRPVSIKQLKLLLGFVCGNFNWLAAWTLYSSLCISRSVYLLMAVWTIFMALLLTTTLFFLFFYNDT